MWIACDNDAVGLTYNGSFFPDDLFVFRSKTAIKHHYTQYLGYYLSNTVNFILAITAYRELISV